MDDYLCITVVSQPGESQANFSGRLSHFWTHMLRTQPDEFKKVYAETTAFGHDGDQMTRQYLVEEGVVDLLEREFRTSSVEHRPIDRDDIYPKYEATPPDWMWIEH